MDIIPDEPLLDENDEGGDEEEDEGEVDEEGRDRRLGAVRLGVGAQKPSVPNLQNKEKDS